MSDELNGFKETRRQTEENKLLIRRLYQSIETRDVARITSFYAPDVYIAAPVLPVGPQHGVKFPRITFWILDKITQEEDHCILDFLATDDKVIVREEVTAKLRLIPFLPIKMGAIVIYQCRDSHIVSKWAHREFTSWSYLYPLAFGLLISTGLNALGFHPQRLLRTAWGRAETRSFLAGMAISSLLGLNAREHGRNLLRNIKGRSGP